MGRASIVIVVPLNPHPSRWSKYPSNIHTQTHLEESHAASLEAAADLLLADQLRVGDGDGIDPRLHLKWRPQQHKLDQIITSDIRRTRRNLVGAVIK